MSLYEIHSFSTYLFFLNIFIHYKIQVKQDPDTKVTVTTEGMKSQESLPDEDWKAHNCVANKLMKMMGWAGGGLGKTEQGVMEPMSTTLVNKIVSWFYRF